MSFFIAILISIGIELGVTSLANWRQFGWFDQLTDWILHRLESTSVRDGPIAVLLILAPVVFGVWLVSAMLGGVWGFFAFVFSIFVLSMSLGPTDPILEVQAYLDALKNDDEDEAKRHAEVFSKRVVDSDPIVTADNIKHQLFVRLCTSILGVFFWFIVLGPIGAALFRATCLLQERYQDVQSGLSRSINDLYNILLWIPARLTVLSFAIVGNFVDTLHSLRQFSDIWRRESAELLSAAGLGAMHHPDQSDEKQVDLDHLNDAIALARRTVLAWLTAFALIIIFVGISDFLSWAD